ncbi:MAG: DUF4382 domain-containing protein [Gammaproteobacteria bacterium]|nr:DUF4382 domain-containing protein [Gammaproteobacteria bacterium]
MINKYFVIPLVIVACMLNLQACSSGGDATTTVAGGGRGGTEYGFVTISITDAPVDIATEVRVQFNGIEFMPADTSSEQEPILVMFDQPVSIDLLELQGNKSKTLLSNEILPTGQYDWIRLKITAIKDGIMDSYIRLVDGSVYELDMPSGLDVGLKIVGGLEIIANTPSAKTIDFDLRKSVVMGALGDFKIKPTLKLVSNDQSGTIEGTVNIGELVSPDCSDLDPDTGNAVYLYEGFNVEPDDIDGLDPEPVASALVKMNGTTGNYEYSFGFVPFGKYTLVMTCSSDIDDPEDDDTLDFTTTKNINLTNSTAKILPQSAFR